MQLVDLILTVCLASNPTSCREEHLYFESRGSLMHCMSLAPAEIVKWSREHPKYKVERWKCAYPTRTKET